MLWNIYEKGKWAQLVKNELPTWSELGVENVSFLFNDLEKEVKHMPPTKELKKKALIFIRLLAITKYVNRRDKTNYNPVHWKNIADLPSTVLYIFRHDELDYFYKNE